MNIEWFLKLPGLFITGGVVLILIALIVFLISGKKGGKTEATDSKPNVDEVNNVSADTTTPVVEPVAPVVEPVTVEPVAPTVEPVTVEPVTPTVEPVAVEPVAPTVEPAPVEPVAPVVGPVAVEPVTPVVNEQEKPANVEEI